MPPAKLIFPKMEFPYLCNYPYKYLPSINTYREGLCTYCEFCHKYFLSIYKFDSVRIETALLKQTFHYFLLQSWKPLRKHTYYFNFSTHSPSHPSWSRKGFSRIAASTHTHNTPSSYVAWYTCSVSYLYVVN